MSFDRSKVRRPAEAGLASCMEARTESEVFAQLKPVCVNVLRSLSVASLASLQEALRGLHHLPSPLLEYVLFPLRMSIRRLGGSDKVLLENVLSSLSLCLSRASLGSLSLSWEVFQELFVFLSMLLDGRMSEGAGYGGPSEERTLRALLALRALLLATTDSLLTQLFLNLPAVGHCVSVTVSSLQLWESREVESVALEVLLALTGLTEEVIATFTGRQGSDCEDTADNLRELQRKVGREGECAGGDGDGGSGGGDGGSGDGDGGSGGGEGGRVSIGEALASFLPGVTLAISKLLTTRTNLGQEITTLCLLVWTRYVCLAMADRWWLGEREKAEADLTRAVKMAEEGKKEPPHTSPPLTPSPPHKGHTLRVERCERWRRETDGRLALLGENMVSVLVTSDGWRVRRGVVLWAHCLLGNCHRSLVTMVPILLETLLSLSHDSYGQISTTSLLSLEFFSVQLAGEVGGELVSVLEEKLYTLASSLPRLMHRQDDLQKVSTLQLLAGYLRLLGPHTLTLTHSPSHLSRLTQALTQTLEIDTDSTHLLEEMHTPSDPPQCEGPGEDEISGPRGDETEISGPREDETWWRLSLRYKHFRLPRVERLVQQCCQLLGFQGSLAALLDHLLDMYHTPVEPRRCELLIVIGHVLLGAGGRGCVRGREKPPHAVCGERMFVLVKGVLEEVTSDGWGGGEEGTQLQCLQLQVVEVCARLLKTAISPQLQRLAYLLLARAGSPHLEVSSLALATLSTVASCTSLSSLSQLITSNADYVVNCVALALRDHTHRQEALQVLQAILEHGAEEVLPLIRDSIDELLLCLDLQVLDNEGVWSVLRSLAAALHRWSPCHVANEEEKGGDGRHSDQNDGREEATEEDIKRFFLDYHYIKQQQQQREEGEQGEEGEEESGRPSQTVEGEERREGVPQPSLSPAEQAAVDILQRCPHFLPSSPSPSLPPSSPSPSPSPSLPPPLPLCVLDCVSHCLHTLRHSQHTLLPQVHKVWPSLVLRLSDSSPPVALRALEVLWDMCEVCGDFVRRRVVEGVWPTLAQSLTTLATGSACADHTYQYSASCKLQLKMLATVGILPTQLQVGASDLETLIHACLPYLSCRQPLCLMEACKASLAALTRSDPDVMWLLLHQLVPTATTPPPHPSLHPYKFPGLTGNEEFTEAATSLLKLTLSFTITS